MQSLAFMLPQVRANWAGISLALAAEVVVDEPITESMMIGRAVNNTGMSTTVNSNTRFLNISAHSFWIMVRTRSKLIISAPLLLDELKVYILQRMSELAHKLDLCTGFHQAADDLRIFVLGMIKPNHQSIIDDPGILHKRHRANQN